MSKLKRIAVGSGTHLTYQKEVVLGIADYIHQQPNWIAFTGPWRTEILIERATATKCDGIIVEISPNVVDAVKQGRLPTVNVSTMLQVCDIDAPIYSVDNFQIGTMAAEHLLNNGHKRLAFCASMIKGGHQLRAEGFRTRAAKARADFSEYIATDWTSNPHADDLTLPLAEWLRNQTFPLGIMADTDQYGRYVTDACRIAGIHVPTQVSVVSFGNDEIVCNLSSPPLSSIRAPGRLIGYKAACAMHRMLDGEDLAGQDQFFPPIDVVTRTSSDLIAVDDPLIAQALRLMRSKAVEGLTIEDTLNELLISRRKLEIGMRKAIGLSPAQVLMNEKLNNAKRLLTEGNASISDIAHQCGFSSQSRLTKAFHHEVGTTPRDFRKRYSNGK